MPGTSTREMERLEDIPNVGVKVAAKLRVLGVEAPSDLAGVDPYELFDELNQRTGLRHDPCLLDTFIAAVRFVEGGPVQPWWAFTSERKRTLVVFG